MTEFQQEEAIKTRLTNLKAYLHTIRQQIQKYEKPKSPLLYFQTSPYPPSGAAINGQRHSSRRNILHQQIKGLQKQINNKAQFIFGTSHKTYKILSDSDRSIPFSVRVYCTRFNILDPLGQLISLLSEDDLDLCSVYGNKMSLVIVSSMTLSIMRVNFVEINKESLQIYDKYIKFSTQGNKIEKSGRTFVFQFKDQKEAHDWYIFIQHVSDVKYSKRNPGAKWSITTVKCKQQMQLQQETHQMNFDQYGKGRVFGFNSHQTSQISKLFSSKYQKQSKCDSFSRKTPRKSSLNSKSNSIFNVKKVNRKQSQRSSSFFLSTSSDKNHNGQVDILKIKQEQLDESVKFQDEGKEKMRMKFDTSPIQYDIPGRQSYHEKGVTKSKSGLIPIPQMEKNQESPKLKKQQDLFMTKKVMSKLEEKKKLLADSSLTKLSIHWHEQPEEKALYPQDDDQSPEKQHSLSSSKQIKLFKKKPSLTRRDSNESPSRYKRVQSATNDKSNEDSSSQAQFERKRKKTDLSLQETKNDTSTERKRNKNQIRDHYLHKLVQKQTIRQMSKSSSRDQSSSKRQLGNLIPIPEKKYDKKILQPSQLQGRGRHETQSCDDSYSYTQTSRQSTQQEIQVQELKNGIVLQKCSKDAWSTKEKKLYLSNTMAQICYCDMQNPLQEKRFFLRDVKSIEYGKVSRGILKHKKRYDESRCLLIRVKKEGKQKVLQFYLQDSEPVYNLQEFAKKLQSFIEKESQNEDIYD